jgi:hypothetical protein
VPSQTVLLSCATAVTVVLTTGVGLLGAGAPARVGPAQRLQLTLQNPPLAGEPVVALAQASGGAAVPVLLPAALPTPTAAPLLAPAVPTATIVATLAPVPSPTPRAVVVLDENFAANALGWPDNSGASAWFTPDGYQLEPRDPGRFAAVTPATATVVTDVQVTATFRKLAGRPAGGGYGIIVRDQGPGSRDGASAAGRYYVLEVGDRGEVGIWRRETDHWVDLVPWTPSATVQTGAALNEVVARAQGARLTLIVNGIQAAQVEDAALASGAVGVFAGGDGNAALLTRFLVQQLP